MEYTAHWFKLFPLRSTGSIVSSGRVYGLNRDPQSSGDMYSAAGDWSLAAMKGKLANKYYARAEEAWAELDEPSGASRDPYTTKGLSWNEFGIVFQK